MAKKVALVIAHQGFQADEYYITKQTLQAAGIDVVTVSDQSGRATGHDESQTEVDCTIDDFIVRHYHGIFLVGGTGALDHLDTPIMHQKLAEVYAIGSAYGAICISPRILARANLLRGKKATGWNKDKELLPLFQTYNVTFVDQPVVIDGNVVTANGPTAAAAFGTAIASVL